MNVGNVVLGYLINLVIGSTSLRCYCHTAYLFFVYSISISYWRKISLFLAIYSLGNNFYIIEMLLAVYVALFPDFLYWNGVFGNYQLVSVRQDAYFLLSAMGFPSPMNCIESENEVYVVPMLAFLRV